MSSHTPALSALVPVTGRHDDLGELHRAIVPELAKLDPEFEVIYLVGTPSSAALAQALRLHETDGEHVRVVSFARPVMEAEALAVGFERARGEILFTVPPFFDAEPTALGVLHAAVCGGADLAFVTRGARAGWIRRLPRRAFNLVASRATGTTFTDVASGTRALRRDVAAEIPLYGELTRFFPVLAHRLGFAVREVPAPVHPGSRRAGLHRPGVFVWRALDILSIFFLSHFTRRPLRLFGAVGSFFGVLGAAVLGMAALERLLGTPLADRPILILGALLLGLGVQSFTIGLLGELLIFFHAREVREYRVSEFVESTNPIPGLRPKGAAPTRRARRSAPEPEVRDARP
jgi:hypothetical protein